MPSSFLTLLVMLVAAGLLVAGLAIALIAFGLLRPPRLNDGKALFWLRRLSPGDLGLEFEDTNFIVRDEQSGRRLKIAGWWIPAPASPVNEASRCIVLLHGYADAKVGAIAWAPLLHELGFHILAIDLRAHGDSEGKHSTAAYFESHDVSQVIDQLRAERPNQTRQLVLFGISLGAAVAVATAMLRRGDRESLGSRAELDSLSPVLGGEGRGEGHLSPDCGAGFQPARNEKFLTDGSPAPHPNPLPRVQGRGDQSDIAAVVLESPYADFRVAALERIGRLGLSGGRVVAAALWVAEWVSDADFDAVRPVDLIRDLPCPLLILSTRGGECPSVAELGPLQAAMNARPAEWGPSELHHFDADPQLLGKVADPQAYHERLRVFFTNALDQPAARAGA